MVASVVVVTVLWAAGVALMVTPRWAVGLCVAADVVCAGALAAMAADTTRWVEEGKPVAGDATSSEVRRRASWTALWVMRRGPDVARECSGWVR